MPWAYLMGVGSSLVSLIKCRRCKANNRLGSRVCICCKGRL
jgi:hypothetical protein